MLQKDLIQVQVQACVHHIDSILSITVATSEVQHLARHSGATVTRLAYTALQGQRGPMRERSFVQRSAQTIYHNYCHHTNTKIKYNNHKFSTQLSLLPLPFPFHHFQFQQWRKYSVCVCGCVFKSLVYCGQSAQQQLKPLITLLRLAAPAGRSSTPHQLTRGAKTQLLVQQVNNRLDILYMRYQS